MVRNMKDMKELSVDSTDIYYPALVDDHYTSRLDALETICLYYIRLCQTLRRSDQA